MNNWRGNLLSAVILIALFNAGATGWKLFGLWIFIETSIRFLLDKDSIIS